MLRIHFVTLTNIPTSYINSNITTIYSRKSIQPSQG